MAKQTVRIVHASDLHFGTAGNQVGVIEWWQAWCGGGNLFPLPTLISSHSEDCVNALADFAYANEPYYDVLLVTGDLATSGGRADIRRAHDFFAAPRVKGHLGSRRQPTLRGLKRPIRVLPGNHDRYGHLAYPGNSRFDDTFFSDWHAGQGAQLLWLEPEESWLALIGVDFTLAKNDLGEPIGPHGLVPGYLGQGRVYRGRLENLVRITQAVREKCPECAVIWAIHFNPVSGDDALRLLDATGRFTQAVTDNEVAAILCGHTHYSGRYSFAGTDVWSCGTTTQHQPAFDNHLHYIEFTFAPGQPRRPAIRVIRFSYQYDNQTQRMAFSPNGVVV
jgi:3',5'-cyclic AMP phosphodiesterase CpdA